MNKKANLTNQTFGRLIVLGRGDDYISPSGAHLLRWKCRCECGNKINATTSQLKRGLSSCGCVSRREDLTGKTFGKLAVLYAVDDYVSPKGSHMSKWHCKCECGNEVDVIGMSLKNGGCKSCGCMSKHRVQSRRDYTGLIFGDLTVINKIDNCKSDKYHCKCSCGNGVDVLQRDLTSGRKTHCGCKTVKKSRVKQIRHMRDYVGENFGELTVIEELEAHITPNGSKQRIVKCKCSCGNEVEIRLTTAQKSKKCADCLAKERRIDITGKRYGKLIVISMADDYISPSGHRLSRCNCLCDCGNACIVNMSSLTTGSTKSCGCISNTCGLLKDNLELMEKYDFDKNQNMDLNSLTARSNVKVWWKCKKCGNSWLAQIASQNDPNEKHGCPYCSGRFVIKGKTDLLSQYPDVVKEWDYENNTILPNEISCFSGKKVWWKCLECGHKWKQTVGNRVSGSGCPKCNIENVNSFCEQAVFYYIRQFFPDAVNGDCHIGMELDIYIPSLSVAIEYDGEAWHKSEKKTEIDNRKNELCIANGIKLIRIREPKLNSIENCIVFVRKDSTSNDTLNEVILDVLKYLGVDTIKIDVSIDTPLILEQFATKKYQNSLAYLYPDIASEWHPIKNGLLTPDKVNKGSGYKVWWLGKCGHEWQAVVSARTSKEYFDKNSNKIVHKPQGCPYCSGKRILIGFNDLQSKRPDIASEWHSKRNGNLRSTDVSCGSNKMVWWLGKCGHEWQATPNQRCNGNSQCPICYKNNLSPAVVCIETQEIFENARQAATFAKLAHTECIYRCCRGEQKTAGGYHWEFSI